MPQTKKPFSLVVEIDKRVNVWKPKVGKFILEMLSMGMNNHWHKLWREAVFYSMESP